MSKVTAEHLVIGSRFFIVGYRRAIGRYSDYTDSVPVEIEITGQYDSVSGEILAKYIVETDAENYGGLAVWLYRICAPQVPRNLSWRQRYPALQPRWSCYASIHYPRRNGGCNCFLGWSQS